MSERASADERPTKRRAIATIALGLVPFVLFGSLCFYFAVPFVTLAIVRSQHESEFVAEYYEEVDIAHALSSASYRKVAPANVLEAIDTPSSQLPVPNRLGILTRCAMRFQATVLKDYSVYSWEPKQVAAGHVRECYVDERAASFGT